jgi:hypothetical protein
MGSARESATFAPHEVQGSSFMPRFAHRVEPTLSLSDGVDRGLDGLGTGGPG